MGPDMKIGVIGLGPVGCTLAAHLQQAGARVIANDIGGIGDAVRHEETGLVVSEAAPAEIAAAIERLIGDPGLVERITAAGRALARARFTRRAAATAFSALFSALRNERPGGALSSARDAS